MKVYYQTSGQRLFVRDGYSPPHTFTDSAEVERRLFRIVEEAGDRSVASRELRRAITDWPSFYHLASQRANILRPFAALLARSRVLEVGCGCGAVTRFLGEIGSGVTALEPSLDRARIAAARCSGLDNVAVYVDDLENFEPPAPFDVATCIGVLEYSPLYFTGADPLAAALARISALLDAGGAVIIAIENRLGLRYFAGLPEEHLDVPFFGIHGLYGPRTPATWGRGEWTHYLREAGFDGVRFYFPFPDYKAPSVILAPGALEQPPAFDVAHMIAGAAGERFRPADTTFSERAAWQSVAGNNLVQDLANSFLIFASKAPLDPGSDIAAYIYSDYRRPEYAKITELRRSNGRMLAGSRKMFAVQAPPAPYTHVLAEEPVLRGRPYTRELDEIMLKPAWNTAAIAQWAAPWVSFLRTHSPGQGLLPENFIDCTPHNIFIASGGALTAFDLEYRAGGPVVFDFVVFRGLWSALLANRRCAPPAVEAGGMRPLVDYVAETLRLLVPPLEPQRLDALIRMEAEFQECITGTSRDQTEDTIRRLELLPTLGGEPVRRSTVFQVFWRTSGSTFSEAASFQQDVPLMDGIEQCVRLPVPPIRGIASIRVDLGDCFGLLIDVRLLLTGAGAAPARSLLEQDLVASDVVFLPDPAGEHGGKTLLLTGGDPHVEFPLSPDDSSRLFQGGVVECRFIWSLNRFRNATATVQQHIHALSTELANVRQGLSAARAVLDETSKENQRLWSVLESRETTLERYRDELNITQTRLQAVLGSYTWRLSAATAGRAVRAYRVLRGRLHPHTRSS